MRIGAALPRWLGVAEAAIWLLTAVCLLRLIPFRRLFREVPPEDDNAPPTGATIHRRVEAIRSNIAAIGNRLPWPPGCMTTALAGHLMCLARGIRVPIALSVAGRANRFGAHATLIAGSDRDCVTRTPAGRTHLGRIEFPWP